MLKKFGEEDFNREDSLYNIKIQIRHNNSQYFDNLVKSICKSLKFDSVLIRREW
jgi:hypothetical protein